MTTIIMSQLTNVQDEWSLAHYHLKISRMYRAHSYIYSQTAVAIPTPFSKRPQSAAYDAIRADDVQRK